MAVIGSNTLEVRRVMQRETDAVTGQVSYFENLQYRTKDVTSSVLGLIPLSSSWSAWKTLARADLIYVDEAGNQITP